MAACDTVRSDAFFYTVAEECKISESRVVGKDLFEKIGNLACCGDVALKLGLTNRRSADITTARQITDLRECRAE